MSSFVYTKCKITSDKRYLIPDDTFTIPQKTSRIERQAEIFDHWDDWQSVTAASINAGFDFIGRISGKFSYDYKKMKSRQYHQNSFSMRIQLRHRFYTIKQLPDSQVSDMIFMNYYMTCISLCDVLINYNYWYVILYGEGCHVFRRPHALVDLNCI